MEVGTAGSITDPAKTTTANQNTGPDVNKLSAMVTNLQKQVQDLQKSALQTSAQLKSPGAPTPQQPAQQPAPSTIKPVGSTPAGQGDQTQQAGVQKPGQTPNQVTGTPSLAPTPKPAPNNQVVPGVNQPTQITNMKIKQQLAQNQGKGT